MSWYGFGMIGKVQEKLPKGKYTIFLLNTGPTKPEFTMNIYASSKLPSMK